MRKVFVRSAFNYDTNVVSRETGTDVGAENLCQQSFKDECDINTIVKRFGLTGEMPQALVPPTYQNFEGIFDYHTAMNAVRAAGEAFMELPADVRKKFKNDPAEFVEFCSKPENVDEMLRMGLASANMDPREVPREVKKEKANVGDSKEGAVSGSKASGESTGAVKGE